MDLYTLKALEFDKILEHLASFCLSEAGKKEALNLCPFSDCETIYKQQNLYNSYLDFKNVSEFNLIDFPDISIPLELMAVNKFQPEQVDFWAFREVLKLAQKAIIAIKNHEKQCGQFFEKTLFAFAEKSTSALIRCIADDMSFKDDSSPALSLIRSELRNLHQNCLRKVKDYTEQYNIAHYLQGEYMSIANDRYVLPLKSNFKGRLQGIIHDYSKTGETLYFEPMFLVDINNNLQELKQEEREEERKIAKFLLELLIQEYDAIKNTWHLLLELDLNEAKLSLANAYYKNTKSDMTMGFCLPMENNLSLINARHPLLLLDNNKSSRPINVQSIDLVFRESDRVLVISGGNAGGKTVALKTLGLITLMSLCALPVPVGHGSCLIPWFQVHAFIGDEQSLDDHVSTFTGQIGHLAKIWNELDHNHLLLLDEFGAGTDPSQGAALAQAVLDGILEKNAYAVSATHFPALKTYALTMDKVRAASVLFDENSKKPLYKLAYDQIGTSLALDVAKEHGLADSILKKAAQYLLIDNENTEIIIDRLNKLAVEREKQLTVLQAEIEKSKQKRKQLQERFEQEKQKLEKELREKSQELMQAWKSEKMSAKQARKEMAQIRAEISNPEEKVNKALETKELKIGMEVIYAPWNKKALIQEIDEKNLKVKINLGGVSLWASFNDLNLSNQNNVVQKKSELVSYKNSGVSYNLDLRGLRADLAMAELEKFIDKSILGSCEQVEIIHGRGTGALRKAVHQYLKNHNAIANYELANEDQGGDGMTIVSFR